MSLPELQQNPLVQRVIEIFDQDGNGEVDFKGRWVAGWASGEKKGEGREGSKRKNLIVRIFTFYSPTTCCGVRWSKVRP